MTAEEAPSRPPGLGSRLYNGETTIDFIGRQRRGLLLSAIVIGLGLAALGLQGLNFGIEFRGGTSWDVPADVSVARVQDVMAEAGFPEAKVQRFTPTNGEPFVRASAKVEGRDAPTREAESVKVRDRLASLSPGEPVSTTVVGPSWGNEITKKARNALVVFFLAIAAYLAMRFEWRMAVAALAAVVHDILVTVGVYALTGLEVTPASVIAFLTILGYSLYDTVVVFDRVDENAKALASTGRATYSDVVNLSMNQTLMRSLNTSLVAILPIMSVLVIGTFVLGATTLRDFGMALFIGLLTGAYSSVFIASPVLAMLKEREPRYRQLRARLEQRGGSGLGLLSAGGAARAGLSGAGRTKPVPASGRPDAPARAAAKARRPGAGGGAVTAKSRVAAGTAVLKPGDRSTSTVPPEVDEPEVDPPPVPDEVAAPPEPVEPAAKKPSAKRATSSAKARRPPPPSYKKAKRPKR
ncbi:MAG: Protein translocase subunit SecF [uncultured Acidimicrobiales bacterium]|uniref:Protein-export membrane protein SecF n=1 Tax=uncultured Acidimicrobiales bacterium TaxID=310071 RepID=A0A6J4H3C1_9ACTN|nr:MAG: Protein translocase subunit SecF [uncultured Acidimicrobiales bacterium]